MIKKRSISSAAILFAILALLSSGYNILIFGAYVYSGAFVGGLRLFVLTPGVVSVVSLIVLVVLVNKLDAIRDENNLDLGEYRKSKLTIFLYTYAALVGAYSIYTAYNSKFNSAYVGTEPSIGLMDFVQFGVIMSNPLIAVILGYLIQAASDILSFKNDLAGSHNA